MRLRIPAWTSGVTVSVNGLAQNVTATPGSYASLTRSWTSGDTVTVRLPMRVVMRPANDNPEAAAVTYGPVLGIRDMSTADGASALQWGDTGTPDHNWQLVPDGTAARLRNLNSTKVLGVEAMATGNGARVLQWADNGAADHLWRFI